MHIKQYLCKLTMITISDILFLSHLINQSKIFFFHLITFLSGSTATFSFIQKVSHIYKEIFTCNSRLYQKQKGRVIAKHNTKIIHKSNIKALTVINVSSHIKHNISNTTKHANALYKK